MMNQQVTVEFKMNTEEFEKQMKVIEGRMISLMRLRSEPQRVATGIDPMPLLIGAAVVAASGEPFSRRALLGLWRRKDS